MLSVKLASCRPASRGLLLVGLLALAGVAQAQNAEPAPVPTFPVPPGITPAQSQPAPNQPMEEITVRGTRTLATVQAEAGRATEAFYAKLNDAVDVDEFKITCDWEATVTENVGSQIRKRVCRTGFQEEQLAEAGRAAYEERPYDPTPVLMEKQRQFSDKILTVINADQELVSAVKHLLSLQNEILLLNGGRSAQPTDSLLPTTEVPSGAAPAN